mmetsp:Transcript_11900/g.35928  ORF Transcript_11900/g.35928 Transcript_11900/m.35928 type:complete len:208 (+) Transcript_11900:46-669(+)
MWCLHTSEELSHGARDAASAAELLRIVRVSAPHTCSDRSACSTCWTCSARLRPHLLRRQSLPSAHRPCPGPRRRRSRAREGSSESRPRSREARTGHCARARAGGPRGAGPLLEAQSLWAGTPGGAPATALRQRPGSHRGRRSCPPCRLRRTWETSSAPAALGARGAAPPAAAAGRSRSSRGKPRRRSRPHRRLRLRPCWAGAAPACP